MCCECNNVFKITKISLLIILIFGIIAITIFITINNNNGEQKSILTAIAKNGDNTAIGNATIRFSENRIIEGSAIEHEEGSDEIRINEEGIYQISYQLYGERETIGTFNFNAVIIVNNEVLLDDTINESPILRDNVVNRMTLTSTIFLRLQEGDVLKLGGISIEDITYTRARIDINKIG